jgi:hypothetical protein
MCLRRAPEKCIADAKASAALEGQSSLSGIPLALMFSIPTENCYPYVFIFTSNPLQMCLYKQMQLAGCTRWGECERNKASNTSLVCSLSPSVRYLPSSVFNICFCALQTRALPNGSSHKYDTEMSIVHLYYQSMSYIFCQASNLQCTQIFL